MKTQSTMCITCESKTSCLSVCTQGHPLELGMWHDYTPISGADSWAVLLASPNNPCGRMWAMQHNLPASSGGHMGPPYSMGTVQFCSTPGCTLCQHDCQYSRPQRQSTHRLHHMEMNRPCMFRPAKSLVQTQSQSVICTAGMRN